ncbi:Actin-binding protein Coronin, contains WD40 repeats [Ceraceosorus bombacis]|uniref:Coronin n=1 Tax=Ceraceosorus bombacis TaxID=401625 RepID=A0A0P1B723_9BASI|nr:Actin-binding protein Coronin, contains WD40 repeats [Ceraceosorus bombacis]
MSRFVRPSKYRHVYGNAAKKEEWYDNIKVSNNAWDTNLIASNGKYISVNWNASGGGAFALVPTSRRGKLPDIYPLARGHTATVLDTAFSPFDDDVLASASDDGTVGIWNVAKEDVWSVLDLSEKERDKAGGVKDISPVSKIQAGGRKVGQVLFHPTASNVLAAATNDSIKLFDLASSTQASKIELTGFTDSIQSLDFNWSGNTLVATCRDRKIRTFDPRVGSQAIQEAESHGGIKGARVVWCGALDRFITTGFSKMSDRQLFLWDSGNVTKPLKTVLLDSSNGVIMPFWSDNNICFLAGKGDGNIRYYELENDELHYLTEYKSTDPQRGMSFIPRRSLNVDENEIARAYKVTGNAVQPISFVVPRRAETFQSDIFPPAPSSVPALSSQEFFAGKTANPNLISLEDGSGVRGDAIVAPAPASIPISPAAPTSAASGPVAPPTPAAAQAPALAPVATPSPATPIKTEASPLSPSADLGKSRFRSRENGAGAAQGGDRTAELVEENEKLRAQTANQSAARQRGTFAMRRCTGRGGSL